MHDVDEYIACLHRGQVLPPRAVRNLCDAITEILFVESNVVQVDSPVTVVGDIHGQFYDLLALLEIGGPLPNTNYLFLGDFVDRGNRSVETISLLFCLKLKYPANVFLIRGNHETRMTTTIYGFLRECQAKYNGSNAEWNYFVEAFNFLPLAAVIANCIFCVHGGMSPSIQVIDQIKIIDRFKEIPSEGPMCDLVWSDPDHTIQNYNVNSRGAGFTFGAQIVYRFLQANGMDTILRAHQLCQGGYESYFNNGLHTVWSAPNYCGRCGNMASVYKIDHQLHGRFLTFHAAARSLEESQAVQMFPWWTLFHLYTPTPTN
ncbi:Metallo-dependent phosphatase-like protein [Dimargaris cristalligena]|uniref:Serine/threonine-protein phosphatase n=1 Tax=Dimargaris cristalligena TaxID=215637 RepID=A0A4P9ZLS1_9FUNG|nr:Metallo-dependent phosphatase-like protein [Dimargaris cristalligena]|eukprot:RKP34085.1 Metallo-dependent phosphatase-like protein [Dimargaris cristalligena]